MSFNLFDKVYVSPDWAYDNSQNRAVFSAARNTSPYTNMNTLASPGYGTTILHWESSVDNIIGSGEGQHESLAHFIKSLYDNDWSGRIYADSESYHKLFFAWLKVAMPNIDVDAAFILYNITRQRESLVEVDNMASRSFSADRVADADAEVIYTQAEFASAYNAFNAADTIDSSYYTSVRDALRDTLCIEIQLAAYLCGDITITPIAIKGQRIHSKIGFGIVSDLREYIRDNIMTEKVRSMTGVTLNWTDPNWMTSLRAANSDMDFLFDRSYDALVENWEYRVAHWDVGLGWLQWVVDNTNADDANDVELQDVIKGAEGMLNRIDGTNLSNTEIRDTAWEDIIADDITYQGTTKVWHYEYMQEKINTFWIEYLYQLKIAENTTQLNKFSHT
jgi:hypothetical protein